MIVQYTREVHYASSRKYSRAHHSGLHSLARGACIQRPGCVGKRAFALWAYWWLPSIRLALARPGALTVPCSASAAWAVRLACPVWPVTALSHASHCLGLPALAGLAYVSILAL